MIENRDKTPKKRAKAKKTDPARDFVLLAEKFKGKKPVRYSMSGAFMVGDVIDHNDFGIGIVVNISYKKMEVVFSEKLRILVCNR